MQPNRLGPKAASGRRRAAEGMAVLVLVAMILMGRMPPAASAAAADFSFIQVSDVHISPRPAGARAEAVRGGDTLRWLCAEAARPQVQQPYNITAPPPSFVMVTGDITEYGVIAETWSDVERAFGCLPCKWFVIPGNHDSTWTSMNHILRRRHGGDSYSFDQAGCHFVAMNSTSPQEPLPCLDRRTLNWLRADLGKVKPGTPVFLFMHHPLYTTEFAAPYEQLLLLDAVAGHRIVVILDGHGHHPTPGKYENIDRVMGGSTYGPNAGCNIISVVGGVLRISYRFHGDKPPEAKLEKRLADTGPMCEIDITSPSPASPIAAGRPVAVAARIQARGTRVTGVKFDVDGEEKKARPLAHKADGCRGEFDAGGLAPGWHFLRLAVADDGKRTWHRAAAFEVLPPATGPVPATVRRHLHDAGVKAAPLALDDRIIVADTAGVVTAFDRAFKPAWQFRTTGEVLNTPVPSGDLLLFGSGDGKVYALRAGTGGKAWQYEAAGPVFAQPVIRDGVAYVGDAEGHIHAVRVKDGRKMWAARHAEFTIEAAGTIVDDTFVVGAWDGWVYAVRLADGSLKWKQRCPTGQSGQPSRYFAAADCPPAVAGNRLFIADRGYFLGLYQPDGKYIRQLQKNVSAVAASEDGRFIYARSLDDGLTKYDAEGAVVWKADVPLGRFPIPPTERTGKVYVCSNRGELNVLDAKDGKALWRYQVSPQLHVMAGVGVDSRGAACTADMDGRIVVVEGR